MKNIVYLHTHDTGRCISPYGYALDTPHLAALSRESALFRKAFDCCPTCSPARASLLTGQYPHQCGMFGLAHRGFHLNDPKRHLASFLRGHGYETVLCGVQHEFAGDAGNLGYELDFQCRETAECEDVARLRMRIDAANTQSACGYLERSHERPFFLSLGLVSTHRKFPQVPDPEDNPDYMRPPAPIPDIPECRLDWAAFSTMVRHVDRCFGQVIGALRRAALLDDTLLIVTSDHGPAFPGMKCTLSDNGCGVMLILRIPGVTSGQVTDALTSHLDVYPTVCDWAGLPPPAWLEGESLLPLISGEKEALRDAVYGEISFHAAADMQRSVRTERYRYVRRFDPYEKTVLPNIDDGIIKRFLVANGEIAERPRIPEEQLFDLYYDPAECHSLSDDPHYRAVLEELREKLDGWMRETGDPLRDGLLTVPVGAFLDRQDAIEPTA
ncbi:MAG: sulfatase [Lentisphaeria bacterium]|nr:sulfatase [Lentisphaeria bacterium]